MNTVGIEDLQEHAEDLLRRVAETGETIEIVYHGRVAARLVPSVSPEPDAARAARRAQTEAILADMDRLAIEIAKAWPDGVSAVDAVRDVRRDL